MLNCKKGLTIPEIIIVIAIIGILSALGAPMMSALKWNARFAEVHSTVEAIVAAEKMYYARNGKYTYTTVDESLMGNGIPAGGTQIQRDLGMNVDTGSYFQYSVYPCSVNPGQYFVAFKEPGYDFSWYYVYYAPAGGTTGWFDVGLGEASGPNHQYFTPK